MYTKNANVWALFFVENKSLDNMMMIIIEVRNTRTTIRNRTLTVKYSQFVLVLMQTANTLSMIVLYWTSPIASGFMYT